METEIFDPRLEDQHENAVVEEKVNSMLDELNFDDLERTQERIQGLPPEIQGVIGPEEERILSVLHHKYEITFDHSFAVAEIANKQYEEFEKELEEASVSRDSYLRAALLHDVGKLGMPDPILKSSLSNRNFHDIFMHHKDNEPAFINSKLSTNGKTVEDLSNGDIEQLDYRDFVSLSQCYEGDEPALDEIRKFGIDPDTTSFMDALKMHERLSEQIVKNMDIPDKDVVAGIVGSHHHYSRKDDEVQGFPKDIIRISVTASELLHLADVYQAIVQQREYDEHPYSQIDALNIIMEQTEKGVFPADIAKRWMKQMMPDKNDISPEEAERYDKLQVFMGLS